MKSIGKIWKIRTVKDYPQAHNHLLVGRVVEITSAYVSLKCRTFHFGKSVAGPKAIREGEEMVRIMPWQRVEIINELPDGFDTAKAVVVGEEGRIVLRDDSYACALTSTYDDRAH